MEGAINIPTKNTIDNTANIMPILYFLKDASSWPMSIFFSFSGNTPIFLPSGLSLYFIQSKLYIHELRKGSCSYTETEQRIAVEAKNPASAGYSVWCG